VTQMSEAMAALTETGSRGHGAERAVTSDLSIDETLLLHSIGWEPVDLVFGVSWYSVPWGAWQWQVGEVVDACSAFTGAMAEASDKMRAESSHVGGSGVVGVNVEVQVRSHHVAVSLTGTAIRRSGASSTGFEFLSDLSARDFVLLSRSGWASISLAAGASFVVAPRRTAGQWASQQGQNVEPHDETRRLLERPSALVALDGRNRMLV